MTRATLDERILRALRKGPLYRPFLETVVGCNSNQSAAALRRLMAAEEVELAREIGPATYRLTASD